MLSEEVCCPLCCRCFFGKYFVCSKQRNGVLYPRTNTTLLNNPRYDEFHVAGFGVAAVGSAQLSFFKHFFVQSEMKAGYINMPDIRTTMHLIDKASQHFEFFQYNILFGGQFMLYDK